MTVLRAGLQASRLWGKSPPCAAPPKACFLCRRRCGSHLLESQNTIATGSRFLCGFAYRDAAGRPSWVCGFKTRQRSVVQCGASSAGTGKSGEEASEISQRSYSSRPGKRGAQEEASEPLLRFYVTCAPGLEEVVLEELRSPLIGALRTQAGSAGVSFVGTRSTGYRANLWLRCAVRVLVELAAAPLSRPTGRRGDPVYEFVRDAADWPALLVDDGPPVDSNSSSKVPSASSKSRFTARRSGKLSSSREDPMNYDAGTRKSEGNEGTVGQAAGSQFGGKWRFRNFAVQSRVSDCSDVTNSMFASTRAKDAICDAIRDACGGIRPEPPAEGGSSADVPLFLSLYRDSAVLYRDLSGVSLHKRGYRDVMHKASLNEGIAAAVLTMAGWNQAMPSFGGANVNDLGEERVLLDPMCGSGTFLIEAALMAQNIAPGLMRSHWPFQTWHDFDEQAWKRCREDAAAAQIPVSSLRLLGNDIHEGALSLCDRDAQSAGVRDMLELSCKDCRLYCPPIVPSLVVVNPPWGSRLADSRDDEEWLGATWQALGRFLKSQCSHADVYVLSGNPFVTRALHMRADKKWPITVGGEERRLIHYHVLPPKSQTQAMSVL